MFHTSSPLVKNSGSNRLQHVLQVATRRQRPPCHGHDVDLLGLLAHRLRQWPHGRFCQLSCFHWNVWHRYKDKRWDEYDCAGRRYLWYVNEVFNPISRSRFRLRTGLSMAGRAVSVLKPDYKSSEFSKHYTDLNRDWLLHWRRHYIVYR